MTMIKRMFSPDRAVGRHRYRSSSFQMPINTFCYDINRIYFNQENVLQIIFVRYLSVVVDNYSNPLYTCGCIILIRCSYHTDNQLAELCAHYSHAVTMWHSTSYTHYCDVIMCTMASQITSLKIGYITVCQAQIKENIKAPRHWPLCGEFTGDRWIPRTNGQ